MKFKGYILLGLMMLITLSGCGSGFEWFPGTPQALKIYTTTLPNAAIGSPYSQILLATGGKTPYVWTVDSGTLPDGLTLNFYGVISGTPTATSTTQTFTAKVTDSASPNVTATQSLTITITGGPLAIATTSLPSVLMGTAYNQTLAATGGSGTYTWALSSGTLPAGLNLNTSTGVISGTASTAQTFTVKVTDSAATPATATQTLTIGVLLGGSVQGKPLTLTNTVTTFVSATSGLLSPFGITTDGTNLYVTDTGNSTIRQIVIATGAVTTIAGTNGTTGSKDGIGTAATFNSPLGITTDGTNLYVADTGNNIIRKIVISTKAVTTLAGATNNFSGPMGITTDGTNLYVADTGNSTIRQIVIATGAVTTIAGTAGTPGSADGIGTAASFSGPQGVTTNGTSLYVADSSNNTIRKIVLATKEVTTIAGTAGVTGSADGAGAAASFNGPSGVSTDGTNLYVADSVNNSIRKIVITTGVVTTVPGASAVLLTPAETTTDGISIYVADTGNNTIGRIQ